MTKKNQNRLWFLFVMGILSFGIVMIIWTVKQATSVPVHESNDFMLKYQMADMNINEIMELEAKFNAKYNIEIKNVQWVELDTDRQNSNSKRTQAKPIALTDGNNSFSYAISTKEGAIVKNAQVDFLLTRPHSRAYDTLEKNVTITNGLYVTKPLQITEKGRYTLQLKIKIDELIGYSEISAYLVK